MGFVKRALMSLFGLSCAATLSAQDSTGRVIRLIGNYDPFQKVPVAVLPIQGSFGDSLRTILERDLDYSDRFTIFATEGIPTAIPALYGAAAGVGAAFVVQATVVPRALHVAVHDVAKQQVVRVDELPLSDSPLGARWRLAVHRISDEIERWLTGTPGIAATKIAFVRGGTVFLVDSDGANEVVLPTAPDATGPAWSPNGATIAYATYGVESRIAAVDVVTGRARSLVAPTRNTNFGSPVFDAYGRLVFAQMGESGTEIRSLSLGGGQPSSLVAGKRGFASMFPAIGPGGRIAYMGDVSGQPEIYTINFDGTGDELLTNYATSAKSYRSDPAWSPDGRWIAYQERDGDGFQLRKIRASGGTPQMLTNLGQNEQPSWAPDSRHIVFTSTRSGVRQLWVVDAESGRVRQLTSAGQARIAAWSPRLSGP